MAKKEAQIIVENGQYWLEAFRNEIQKEYQKIERLNDRIRNPEIFLQIRRSKKSLRGEDLTIHTSPDKIHQFRQEYGKRCQRLIDHYYRPLLLWKERLDH